MRTIERNQLLQQFVSVKVTNSIGQGRGRGQLKRNAIIARERESDLSMANRLQMELVLNIPALGIFRAQKLATRRYVVKKRAHLHLRPGRFAAVAHDVDLAAIDNDLGPGNRIWFASGQAKTRHASDARQRFTAETESVDRFQVRHRSDFAGGMPLE